MGWIDRRHLRHLDYTLLAAVLALCMIGIMTIYSASVNQGSVHYDRGQWQRLAVGLAAMLVMITLPYQRLVQRAWAPYAMVLVLLVIVLFMPGGVKRWIPIGGSRIQPSELAKVAVVLFLARLLGGTLASRGLSTLLLEKLEGRGLTWQRALKAIVAVCVPALLIALEPDLGTALVFFPILLTALVVTGLSSRILISGGVATAAGALFVYSGMMRRFLEFPWVMAQLQKVLAPYQIARIVKFPGELGYQVIQARIAIGSGGLWGKGYLMGTQSRLQFIPEHHTDFIFSVFAEEWGFLGCLVLLGIYFVVLWRGLLAAREAGHPSGMLLATGGVTVLATQLLINVGMVVGLLPVTGLPLPFLTYGGSGLIINLMIVGLLLNVGMRRFE